MSTTAKVGAGVAGLVVLMVVLTSMAMTTMHASAAQDEQEQVAHRNRMMQQAGCLTDTTGAGSQEAGSQKAAPSGAEQRQNAEAVAAEARRRKLPPRAAQIAIATALQESGLRNISYGDRDSVGLFQQRPSKGWGTVRQILNPRYAAGQFYDRLVHIKGWESKPLTKVAQAVQRSAYPDAYAKWESAAKKLVEEVWSEANLSQSAPAGRGCLEAGGSQETATGAAGKVLAAARTQIGKPYVWGGGGYNGPTGGGFDCSGLTQYAVYQATGGKVRLPRTSQEQRHVGAQVSKDRMKPGDLIVIDNDGNWGHIGIYAGGGKMLHAPRTGKDVELTALKGYWDSFPWDVRRAV